MFRISDTQCHQTKYIENQHVKGILCKMAVFLYRFICYKIECKCCKRRETVYVLLCNLYLYTPVLDCNLVQLSYMLT